MGLCRDWAGWALREKKEGEEKKVGWVEIERRKKFSFCLTQTHLNKFI